MPSAPCAHRLNHVIERRHALPATLGDIGRPASGSPITHGTDAAVSRPCCVICLRSALAHARKATSGASNGATGRIGMALAQRPRSGCPASKSRAMCSWHRAFSRFSEPAAWDILPSKAAGPPIREVLLYSGGRLLQVGFTREGLHGSLV
jgi:hypothetical protein